MSWEGWDQLLCENGHYQGSDSPPMFGQHGSGFKCWVHGCKGKLAWWNQVDETNKSGGSDGIVKLRLKKKAVFCKCPKCQTIQMKKPEEYYIPKTKGHRV